MPQLIFLLAVAAVMVASGLSLQEYAARVAEAISNFRGGPGSPSHPVPGNDSRILNRRRRERKATDE